MMRRILVDRARALREEVDAMLAAHGEAARFGGTAVSASTVHVPRLASGAMIGPYRVDRLIGAGGVGPIFRLKPEAAAEKGRRRVMRPTCHALLTIWLVTGPAAAQQPGPATFRVLERGMPVGSASAELTREDDG
jgi:hypothetical protein